MSLERPNERRTKEIVERELGTSLDRADKNGERISGPRAAHSPPPPVYR